MEIKDREEVIIAGLGTDTRNLRDIFLVFAALDYGCGLFVWSLYASMNDVVLKDVLNIQYFVGGFPLAVAISSVFFVVKYVKTVSLAAFRILGIVMIIAFISSFQGTSPFVKDASVVLLIMSVPFLLAISITNWVHDRPESFLGISTKRFYEIADKIANYTKLPAMFMNFIAMLILVVFYEVIIYPKVPQSLGGARPRWPLSMSTRIK